MSEQAENLRGKTIALPESRQLDVLSTMLQKRGAEVVRCPLVAILDTPDSDAVFGWLRRCIDQPFDYLILLTGEGLRRLLSFAEAQNLQEALIGSLARVQTIARGPKPGQALREVGLKPDIVAQQPTTDGVITTLAGIELDGRRVGVQLYGSEPNLKLIDYLRSRGAHVDTVAPYIYAPDSDEQQVLRLIDALAASRIDAIAFTSQPQLHRLVAVAEKHQRRTDLLDALSTTTVAAVGPLVADALRAAGIRVDLMPESSYFMKPMVSELVKRFAAQ